MTAVNGRAPIIVDGVDFTEVMTPAEVAHLFRFYDTWQWDLRDYTWRFFWCCHAIVWGIGQYDAAKAPAQSGGGE